MDGEEQNAPEGRCWYAIRTKPHKEEVARVNYQNQHLVVYLPRMRVIRRHARRTDEVLRPIFPGYLFLHLAPAECNWAAIAGTRGVLGPVCFGEYHYPPVPDWVLENLKAKEDEEGIITPGAFVKPRLTAGTEVEVELEGGGVARGFFCSFRGEENVVILLDLLQRQVRATVSLNQIRPL